MRKNVSGVELRLDGVHRLAEQVRVGADVQLDVVAGRLDPVDLVGAHEEDAAARLDDEAIERAAAPASDPGRARAGGARGRRSRALELLPRARERLAEALAIERLQQVVERVHVERAQRVLVVGGDEDDERQLAPAPTRVDRRRSRWRRASARRGTRGPGLSCADGIDRRRAVVALADDLESGSCRASSVRSRSRASGSSSAIRTRVGAVASVMPRGRRLRRCQAATPC